MILVVSSFASVDACSFWDSNPRPLRVPSRTAWAIWSSLLVTTCTHLRAQGRQTTRWACIRNSVQPGTSSMSSSCVCFQGLQIVKPSWLQKMYAIVGKRYCSGSELGNANRLHVEQKQSEVSESHRVSERRWHTFQLIVRAIAADRDSDYMSLRW